MFLSKPTFTGHNTKSDFCLQMFGCGAVAQVVLSKGSHGIFLTVNFAFGFGATLGILVCGQVSGKQSLSNLFYEILIVDTLE